MTDYTDLATRLISTAADDRGVIALSEPASDIVDVLEVYIEPDAVVLDVRTAHQSDRTPEEVWNGAVRRAELARGPGVVDVDALRAALADGRGLARSIDTVRAGMDVVQHGITRRGTLDDAGTEALLAIDGASGGERGARYLRGDIEVVDPALHLQGQESATSIVEWLELDLDADAAAIEAAAGEQADQDGPGIEYAGGQEAMVDAIKALLAEAREEAAALADEEG